MPIALAALATCVLLVLWLFPKLQVRGLRGEITTERAKELENEFRKTTAQALGGLLVLGGLAFTWQQLAQTKQKEATDTFALAVGHLAHKNAHVRIGGAYTIGSLASNFPDKKQMATDVLCAFVRDNAAWRDAPLQQRLATDTEVAVRVLSHISSDGPDGSDIDLSDTDLRRGQFLNSQLRKALLLGTHLEAANLERSDLRGAQLQGSHLDGANLRDSDLRGADLTGASVVQTHFEGANLMNAVGTDVESVMSRAFVDRRTVLPRGKEAP